ncbi:MAG: phenylacetate--CoA ligase family protein [Ignavibacteria bacterium]
MKNKILNFVLLKKNIYASREALDELRFSLLKKQLLHSYRTIPYYKKTFDEAGVSPEKLKSINDLVYFPIINKNIVRLHYSELINRKAFLKNKFKSHTSGSTGQPMWTYYDLISWIRKKYLVKARARLECGIKFNERIAIFEAASPEYTEKRNKSFLYKAILPRVKVFSIFEPLDRTIEKLYRFSPQALYGSPSYFFQLAQLLAKKNFPIPSIKRLFTSSEYLQENVRNYIEKIFKADLYDIYGSTEFKEAAWECEMHEGYHINEDEVIVEVLNDERPAPAGVPGSIVITDLRNTAMPLIRYQMHDKGMLIEKKCSCGRTFSLMKPYAGRSSEYIILPGDEILSPYLFTTSIEKIDGLLQYQIIQTEKKKLTARIITSDDNFNTVADAVRKILSGITKHLMEIEIERSTGIETEENGKFKVVKNLLLEHPFS